ncbi:MAG: hypothetical protein ACK52P_11430, partial [Alphaproteobacteria bacterium]
MLKTTITCLVLLTRRQGHVFGVTQPMQNSYPAIAVFPDASGQHFPPMDGALRDLGERAKVLADQAQLLMQAASRNSDRLGDSHAPRVAGALKAVAEAAQALSLSGSPQKALGLWLDYLRD